MLTYPPEYLAHPVPVMAVYGLSDKEESPLVDVGDSATTRSGPSSSLLDLLTSKSDYSVYEATRFLGNNQIAPPFRVINVPKDYMLPQKPTPSTPNLPPPHSNLSPLSNDSPLYPDGIMTPLWIKKHLYLPSAVVGFYDMFAGSQAKRETGPLASQVLIDPLDREHDMQLAAEINNRRKYFQEKGVRFAAVVMLKQRPIDQSIEERLSLIRKQCGLDAKTSFFAFVPGSPTENQEFVHALYRALYDPALQFYTNRLKKIRKKKSKLPSPSTVPRQHDLSTNEPQPLSVSGWMLRYDLKAAFFQETKQDMDGALKLYEAVYSQLADMLAPTMGHHLAIHGKRWLEARTLVDCINVKICRLQLYMNEPTAALSQLNGHLHMFQSYSPTWGMSEHTFEYWAWLSKQYRIFADVIDAAVQSGYKIPMPTSYLSASSNSPLLSGNTHPSGTSGNSNSGGGIGSGNVASGGIGIGIASHVGCNPGAILQHPGFYYHLAAMCCAERRRRFIEAERSNASPKSTAFQAEKSVDHSSLTIELLTKSYEQFKRYRNSRMTLYLAAEIAGTYYETGKFEMAVKFFERIGKTYRKEKWYMVLTSILRWSLRCAKELASWERAIECLIELMSDDLPMADNKRNDTQKELFDILASPDKSPKEKKHLVIQMDQINAFFSCQVQMKCQKNFVGTPIEYQVLIKTDKTSPPTPMRFQAVRIIFSDPQYNVVLKDAAIEETTPPLVDLIDFSNQLHNIVDEEDEHQNWLTAQADLRVYKGQVKALQGSFIPKECGDLKILSICFDLISPYWHVELSYGMDKIVEEHPAPRRKWLQPSTNDKPNFRILEGRGCLSNATIMQKPPSIDIKFEHSAPALLDELFKLNVIIKSSEDEPIEATLHVDMKNTEGSIDEDYVTFSPEITAEATQQFDIGCIQPHTSLSKAIYLHGGKAAGSRLIHVTVKYTLAGKDSSQMVEKSEPIRIPFIAPFDVNFELCAQSKKPQISMSPSLERSERWLLVAAIRCSSTWDLDIKHVELQRDETFSDPNTSLSLISRIEDFDNQTWNTGHVYNANYLFQLSTLDITEQQSSAPTGSIVIEWKRSNHNTQEENKPVYYKTLLVSPAIQFQQQCLNILANIPSEIYLGEPFTLTYTIDNPTPRLADYNASIELSEAFVFSGYKQFKGRVLPFSKMVYQYTCYPLLAGKVKLPRLKVLASQQYTGEREVPVEAVGSGLSITFDNELHQRQTSSPPSTSDQSQPLLAFVNAKRYF
ncbi:Gryzun, putative trafficking through golgi-domain-containing protein [Choanephora cucurbitarum]|nr:Gryzun, putative trafficking through golgi-domain-containing protein [Choanephora cucurbitarum]